PTAGCARRRLPRPLRREHGDFELEWEWRVARGAAYFRRSRRWWRESLMADALQREAAPMPSTVSWDLFLGGEQHRAVRHAVERRRGRDADAAAVRADGRRHCFDDLAKDARAILPGPAVGAR